MNLFMFPTTMSSEITPTLFKSDQPTRHVAIVSKPTAFSLLSEEDLIKEVQRNTTGEIRAIYQYSSLNRMIIISYYSLQSAKQCLNFVDKRFKADFHTYYVKPCCVHKSMNEKVLVTINNISNQIIPIKQFNYMEHLTQFGAIYSTSEAMITPFCIAVNLEYEDERSAKALYAQYDQTVIEGVQFNVHATVNDRFACTCHETVISNHIIYPNDDSLFSTLQQPSGYSYFSISPFRPASAHDNASLSPSPPPPLRSPTASSNLRSLNQPIRITNEKSETGSSVSSSSSSSEHSQTSSHVNTNNRNTQAQDTTSVRIINDIELDKIENGQDKRTTFMIRNIPNKYTQQMLIDCINSTHGSTYDFIYLPIDFQNKCNVGYAFINFVDPKTAILFIKERVGKKWKHFNSDKKFSLSYANIQGKRALIKKFKNSNIMAEDIAYRPKIFHSSGQHKGKEQEFPKPDFISNDDRGSTSATNSRSRQSYTQKRR